MLKDDFAVIYSGASFQADLLKSLLEGKGIRAILEDEFLGRMVLPVPNTRTSFS